MSPLSALVIILTAGVSASAMAAAEWTPDAAGHEKIIAPFLTKYCADCHSGEKVKGKFHTARHLTQNFMDRAVRGKWAEVVDVLNGYQMPPEDETQPSPAETAAVVDWITAQMLRAEEAQRENTIVMRRLNRAEYRNTIRDLCGVEMDVSALPQDPLAAGFDNNGRALTLSPMHLEIYLDMARRILDRALVEGEAPVPIKWRFQVEEGSGDDHRVRLDKTNNAISHSGKNQKENGMAVMHHASWDRDVNVRDFRVPVAGEYIIRIRSGGRIPGREEVVTSARKELERRISESKNPKEKGWQEKNLEQDLEHFRQDRMYDYGPPRLKLTLTLGGQPRVVDEFDIPASHTDPAEHVTRVRLTTESAGMNYEYAYSVPQVLENFWMQGHDSFARPEAWVDWIELEGPIQAAWPPPSHRLIMDAAGNGGEREQARAVLAAFMPRAYRRSVAPAEVEEKLALYDRARKDYPTLISALRIPLSAVLTSPHFLYIAEPSSGAESRSLTDPEIASRLSYFLWSTMPDAPLTALAAGGGLRASLPAQADRMLADPRSAAFVSSFAGQWLGLREVGANPPAPDLYPAYDRHLESSISAEGLAFFREVLEHDLSVLNFIRSDFVVINERLARFYGIDGVRGDQFRRVPLPPGVQRGGVLTQPAMLSITSNGTRTSPVKRGVWVLKNLLGTDPGLPVANVGDIKPKVPGIDKATVRQRLAIHRELPQCARCHDRIDPLGLALENFNAAGEWRHQEGFGYKGRIEKSDPVIDASAQMPDGTPINGVAGLQDQLLKNEDKFLYCLSAKLLTHALGREPALADRPLLQAAVVHLKTHDRSLRSLIHFLIQSPAFLHK